MESQIRKNNNTSEYEYEHTYLERLQNEQRGLIDSITRGKMLLAAIESPRGRIRLTFDCEWIADMSRSFDFYVDALPEETVELRKLITQVLEIQLAKYKRIQAELYARVEEQLHEE